MKFWLTGIYNLLASWNPVFTGLSVAVPTVIAVFIFIESQVTEMMARIDSMPAVASLGPVSFGPLGLIDHFFPLSETITMFIAWITVFLIAVGIRMVKSFIPTIAS